MSGTTTGQVEKIDCEAKNYFPPAAKKNPGCKKCNPCNDSPHCVLVPYTPDCCGKNDMTGHHLIPVHCFMDPGERKAGGEEVYEDWEGYSENFAPCICVDKGAVGKKGPSHEIMHECFDPKEDEHSINHAPPGSGTWTYKQARDAAALCAKEMLGCNEKCIKDQLDEYHDRLNSRKHKPLKKRLLRADSRLGLEPSKSLKTVARGKRIGISAISGKT